MSCASLIGFNHSPLKAPKRGESHAMGICAASASFCSMHRLPNWPPMRRTAVKTDVCYVTKNDLLRTDQGVLYALASIQDRLSASDHRHVIALTSPVTECILKCSNFFTHADALQ